MKFRMGSALLSLAGIFVAAYLWLYKQGRIGSIVCGTGGCETVQFSRWSEFLGVDVALIGVAGYVVLLAIALAGVQRPEARWPSRWQVVCGRRPCGRRRPPRRRGRAAGLLPMPG